MMAPLLFGQYIDTFRPAVDGVIITVENYARWLNRRPGCACYVACPTAPAGYREEAEYPVYRYRSAAIPARPPYRLGLPVMDMGFIAAEHQLSPCLVHAHTPFAAGLEALRQARSCHIPLVASFHSKYYDDILAATGQPLLAEGAVEAIIAFYRQADAVWTVNRGTAETLRSYGYRGEILLMPNGTDFVWPRDAAVTVARVRQQYRLDPETPLLLFVGQQIRQKNIPMILDACALLRDRGQAFRLMLVGEGRDAEALKAQCHALALEDRVLFAGAVKDRARLSALYLAADLFVFPSLYDNAPLVIREAAMAGCPSVLVEGSNAAEDCRDGVDAYLCREDARALADTVARALADPRLAAVGRAARRHLALTWEEVADRVEAAYRDILGAF